MNSPEALDRWLRALRGADSLFEAAGEEALAAALLDQLAALFPGARAEVVFENALDRKGRCFARGFDAPSADSVEREMARALALVPAKPGERSSLLVAPLRCGPDSFGLVWMSPPESFSNDPQAPLLFDHLASTASRALRFLGLTGKSRTQSEALQTLSQYLPKQLIRELLAGNVTMPVEGELRDITVLFADLRGFTAASERMPATAVVSMLNAFFTRMVLCVHHNDGMLDKFIGDAVMAFWGVPVARREDPVLAICAAAGMQQELAELNLEFEAAGRPKLALGIGIHSGTAAVGNIGSQARKNWTAVGATVNLASRIEGTAGANQIHVSEATYQRVKHAFGGDPLQPMKLKNVEDPVQIYRIRTEDME